MNYPKSSPISSESSVKSPLARHWEKFCDVPSVVLFMRNIPKEATDQDIMSICRPFGPIESVYQVKEKSCCFVQFEQMEHSMTCYNYYSSNPCVLGSQQIQFAFSDKDVIAPNELNPPSKIILVTISSVMYPVSVSVVNELFYKYGRLEKVVIFERGANVQVIVQMSMIEEASAAKNAMDKQCIYTGCNYMQINYSNLSEVVVKYNNNRSWDFTIPSNSISQMPGILNPANRVEMAPEYSYDENNDFFYQMAAQSHLQTMGSTQSFFESGMGMDGLGYQIPPAPPGAPAPPEKKVASFNKNTQKVEFQADPTAVCICFNLNETDTVASDLAAMFACYGNVVISKVMFKKRSIGLVQLQTREQCALAVENLNGVMLRGNQIKVEMSKSSIVKPTSESELCMLINGQREYCRHKQNRPQQVQPPNPILHVCNLPSNIYPNEVCAHFEEVSGMKPSKVWFLDELHQMCMATFDNTETATHALVAAQNVHFRGRALKVGYGHAGKKYNNQF